MLLKPAGVAFGTKVSTHEDETKGHIQTGQTDHKSY